MKRCLECNTYQPDSAQYCYHCGRDLVRVNEFYGATKPNPDRGVDGITPDGIPIQTKSYLVKYPVLTQAATDIKLHPVVPKPVSKAIIVSQTGFDDSARQAQFGVKQEYGVDFELATPESMLEADTAKRVRVIR